VLLLYPGYGAMFHELSSEPVFAAAFAGWALLVVRAGIRPSIARFALVGLGVAVLAFARPGNAVLIAFVLFPLVVRGTWKERVSWAGVFLAAAVVPLTAWSVHNGVRFGEYTLARGGNAVIPFYRAFITDRIVSPENGASSRRLARAVEQHLLTREPYRSYGVTLDDVFTSGSFRIHEDLYLVSDQFFGWDTDYEVLRDAGLEAVREHPLTYTGAVLDTIWQQLSEPFYRVVSAEVEGSGGGGRGETIVVDGKRLPKPTEGQPIPGGQVVWISRPDNGIRQVWTSPTRYTFAFADPADRPRLARVQREVESLMAELPDRTGNATLGVRLNQLSRWYPRPVLWIVVRLVAIAFRRPRDTRTLVALSLAALLVISLNALGQPADLHFALPVLPAFVLFGCGGLLGHRAERRTSLASHGRWYRRSR
jgi:hypothetical protein